MAAALGLPKDRGEIIQRVEDGQAAAKAGLKRGDVVTKINGKEITPQQTLSYIVANIKPGTRVPIEVIREGKTLSLSAVIGTRPPESELTGENFDPEAEQTLPEDPTGTANQAIQDQLGMAVQPLTSAIARSNGVDAGTKGMVNGAVGGNSDAGRKGLRRGDIIPSATRSRSDERRAGHECVSKCRSRWS